jgi:molybdate transport system ATP-binding protein
VSALELRCRVERGAFCLDVDLALPARGISAIFGASGSGKTTLLRVVAGLERTRHARVAIGATVWNDGALHVPAHRREIGYVFQEASLFTHLSVAGNIDYGRRRSARGLDAAALAALVTMLGIAPLRARRPATLSGGERQRVAIARALATGPQVLLMDEPLAALDAARKNDILPYLERLHDALAIPVLYVSHAPDEVARLADHVVVLDAGRVSASGTVEALFSRPGCVLAQGDDAGVVWQGRVEAIDADYHLCRLACPGGALWVRADGKPAGTAVRVRILARDVSLALSAADASSILNRLAAVVTRIDADTHPAQVLVWLAAADATLCARITRRSADHLALQPGLPVWAQIKSVALLR